MRYRLAFALLIFPLCLLGMAVSAVWLLVSSLAGSRRAWRIAIGVDDLVNITTGDDEGWTISSRCWRYRDEQPYRTLRWMIDGAFGLAGFPDHCETAFDVAMARAKKIVDSHLGDD